MGNVRGMATIGSSLAPLGKTRPSLGASSGRTNAKLLAYVDFFVDDFLGLAQGPRHRRRHVRRTLFHALEKLFRTLDRQDAKQRK